VIQQMNEKLRRNLNMLEFEIDLSTSPPRQIANYTLRVHRRIPI
jgi:hypothetical protein